MFRNKNICPEGRSFSFAHVSTNDVQFCIINVDSKNLQVMMGFLLNIRSLVLLLLL